MSVRMAFIFVCAFFLAIFAQSNGTSTRTISFDEPIDALSMGTKEKELNTEVRFLENDAWGEWQALEIEDEQNPLSKESNLIISKNPTSKIQVRGETKDYEIHPIRVSHEPSSYEVAAVGTFKPLILSRKQWGADESILYTKENGGNSNAENEEADNGGGETPNKRLTDCELAQRDYPNEFKVARTVREDVGSSRVDLQACKLEYSIVSPK